MPAIADRNIPKYVQIKESVKDGILRGDWGVGDQLPTCRELTQQFDVAPMTVWKALDELVKDNLVHRVRGKGSFVRDHLPAVDEELLGVIMRPDGDCYGAIYRHLLSLFGALGRHVISTDIGDQHRLPKKTCERLLAGFLSRDLSSMVIDGCAFLPFPMLRDWHQNGRQLTFLLRCETNLPFPRANRILTDWQAGGRLVARHLLRDGGQRLLMVSHSFEALGPRQGFLWEIIRGVEAVLDEAGLEHSALRIAFDTPSADPDTTIREALREGFDRVFCIGDFRAPRVYRIAEEEGMHIGSDIRVCGYYDTPWAAMLKPALTSVAVAEDRLATTAVEAVTHGWEGEHVAIEPKLCIRESSA